jgi:hypothetical protein
MVAAAAFLIILVILFGLENVRNFVFGTFGIAAWIVLGVLGLGALIMFEEWLIKALKGDKKAHNAQKQAEKALVRDMKKNDPKTYKSIVRTRKFALISLIAFLVVFGGLIALLIIFH